MRSDRHLNDDRRLRMPSDVVTKAIASTVPNAIAVRSRARESEHAIPALGLQRPGDRVAPRESCGMRGRITPWEGIPGRSLVRPCMVVPDSPAGPLVTYARSKADGIYELVDHDGLNVFRVRKPEAPALSA